MSAPVLRRLAGSFQFLTILPIHGETSPAAEAAIFFPIAGAGMGAFAGAIARYASAAFGRSLGSLLALTGLLWVSGGLHEDGLADVADAVRAGRSRERILEILKDSRIGAYGAGSLIVFFLLRWQAIENMPVASVAGLGVAVALSRASMVIVAGSTPSAGEGLGRAFSTDCRRGALWAALFQCALLLAAFGWYEGWRIAAALAVACGLVIGCARAWFVRRLSGVNGDCLGAVCVFVETAALLVLAWRRSS
jgi:adenosylcobinamide-GDP ribazoletransferase